MVNKNASAIPKATNMPKTCTGGIGVNDNEAKPTAEVMEVNSMGRNRLLITVLTLSLATCAVPGGAV